MHVDAERLQRLLDGELDSTEADRVRAHLTTCPACRAEFEHSSAEWAEVKTLLTDLDQPVPALDAAGIMRSVDGRQPRRRLAQAALVVVGLGVAGAAWAAPGSPLPRWLASLNPWSAGTEHRDGPSAPSVPWRGGLQVTRDSVTIAFSDHPTGGELAIHLTQDSLLSLRTVSGDASFTDEADGHRVTVEPRSESVDYRIDIPERARWVEITVSGNRTFLKDGRNLTSSSMPDSLGVRRVPLTRSGG